MAEACLHTRDGPASASGVWSIDVYATEQWGVLEAACRHACREIGEHQGGQECDTQACCNKVQHGAEVVSVKSELGAKAGQGSIIGTYKETPPSSFP